MDLLVHFEVQGLKIITLNTGFNELLLVLFLLFLLESIHVCGHVITENTITVCLSTVLPLVRIVAIEFLLRVGDLQTTIEGALHCRKNLGPKGGTLKAYIEQCLESIGSLRHFRGRSSLQTQQSLRECPQTCHPSCTSSEDDERTKDRRSTRRSSWSDQPQGRSA